MKRMLLICLLILCLLPLGGWAEEAAPAVSPADGSTVDLSGFREHPEAYLVTDLEGATFVASPLSEYAYFPLPAWGEDSRALAYFAIISFSGEEPFVVPALLVTVFTDRPRNVQSLTIPVDGQAFTFSWPQDPDALVATENGYRQDLHVYLGPENTAFIDAMNAKATSVTDPQLLLGMPLEITFHGDDDCTAVMSEYTMLDYTMVVFAGYCYTLDGLNRYIGTAPSTAMAVRGADEPQAEAPAVETVEAGSTEAAVAVPESAESAAAAPETVEVGTADTETVEAAAPQPIRLSDLVGVWALESVRYNGQVITAEDLAALGSGTMTTEFTSDGLMILEGGNAAEVHEFPVSDGIIFPGQDSDAFRLEDGKLVFEVTDVPGMSMTYVRTDLPGREKTAAVDDAIVGTWYFEQLITRGDDLPGDLPLPADMFHLIYGVPAPTLRVRKGGLAMMALGEDTVTFPAEVWLLEDGKLTYTSGRENGHTQTWYFVREPVETVGSEEAGAPAESREAEAPVGSQESAARPADESSAEAGYAFHGASWGMTRAEVRQLEKEEPVVEPSDAAGHSALVYRVGEPPLFYMLQYNFQPSDALYNIEIMAPDADGTFYDGQRETFTALYGEPLTEAGADEHAEDPVAVMMALLTQNTSDTDFLGWQADDETVIIMSREPTYGVCYVEIRRYTDYFRFD